MKTSVLWIFLLFCAFTSGRPARAQSQADVDFDHVEGSVLYFKAPTGTPAPKPLSVSLFDLKYLGTLRGAEDDIVPFFLFTGKPCQNCLQDSAVYAYRPAPGRPTTFVHPGKILDPKSRALLVESRAFFGRCLPQKSDVYVVFQKERVDRRSRMQSSVFVAEVGRDHMEEKLLERKLPRLQDTLKRVKSKTCHEIEGRNRMMLSKPLDLNLRKHSDDMDDDDQDPKENQTDADLPAQQQ